MSQLVSTPIVVLDGALGTAVQDFYSAPIESSLWAASLIHDSPSTLTAVHNGYLDSGADIVSTATYQCSFEGFRNEGFTRSQAVDFMRQGVKLVHDAMVKSKGERRQNTTTRSAQRARCALSLGPYGAIMQPGQEYGGNYPSEFCDKQRLKEWHRERLDVFMNNVETWKCVDIVAFETVPREDEAEAIVDLMSELEDSECMHGKEWWISFVYPYGVRPDGGSLDTLVKRVCKEETTTRGIGINCTKPQYLPDLVSQYTAVVKALGLTVRPSLVLYPDGGLTYDPVTKSWSAEDKMDDMTWAIHLMKVVEMAIAEGVWENVIVGGCCKAGFANIKCLRQLVDNRRIVA